MFAKEANDLHVEGIAARKEGIVGAVAYRVEFAIGQIGGDGDGVIEGDEGVVGAVDDQGWVGDRLRGEARADVGGIEVGLESGGEAGAEDGGGDNAAGDVRDFPAGGAAHGGIE